MTLNKMVTSLLTPVSDLVFNALSDGTIHFALYGSSLNHNLIGWNNFNSQSESFVMVVLKAAMERKKNGTIWQSNKNGVRNWCQKQHTILFTATNWENKQWRVTLRVWKLWYWANLSKPVERNGKSWLQDPNEPWCQTSHHLQLHQVPFLAIRYSGTTAIR